MKQDNNDQDLFELETTSHTANTIAAGEVIIGTFTGLNDNGKALVDFSHNHSSQPLEAITTLTLNQSQSGRQVALLFEAGNLNKPIIMGLIQNQLDEILENFQFSVSNNTDESESSAEKNTTESKADDVYVDGNRVVLEGKEEVVLKCGEASITLTKAGKIIIRGKYLLNRSSGVNRIMGGSVQIN